MKANQITAIGVSIIALGVVAGGITWGVKEFDKTSKQNAKRECMGKGSSYYYYLEMVKDRGYSYSDYMQGAQDLLEKCLAKKGYSLGY